MSKKQLVAVAIMTCLVLMLGIAPANAAGTGAIVFVGKATVGAGLCYPNLGQLCDPHGPVPFAFNASQKTPDPHGGPSICLGAEVSAKKVAVNGPNCDISATGTVFPGPLGAVLDAVGDPDPHGPFCGDSSGAINTGTISFYLSQAAKNSLSFTGGWPLSVGGTLPILGTVTKGAQSGPAVVIVNAAPDSVFKQQSCTTGASSFRVVGVGASVAL